MGDESGRRVVALRQMDIRAGHRRRIEKDRRAILMEVPCNHVVEAFREVESAASGPEQFLPNLGFGFHAGGYIGG